MIFKKFGNFLSFYGHVADLLIPNKQKFQYSKIISKNQVSIYRIQNALCSSKRYLFNTPGKRNVTAQPVC